MTHTCGPHAQKTTPFVRVSLSLERFEGVVRGYRFPWNLSARNCRRATQEAPCAVTLTVGSLWREWSVLVPTSGQYILNKGLPTPGIVWPFLTSKRGVRQK